MKVFRRLVTLLPAILIFLVFIKPVFGDGLIVGGDWTFPYSNKQLSAFAADGMNLWSFREIPTGTQVPHQNLYLFQLIMGISSKFGVNGVVFQKSFVALVLALIYYSAYFLFLKISGKSFPSLVGAAVYLLSPVIFNYFNMGWIFVLLFMGLVPLFIMLWIKYSESGNFGALLGIGVISSISFLQSQAIFWFPLVLVGCAISFLDKHRFREILLKAFACFLSMFIITFLVHMVWIIPDSLNTEQYLLSSVSAADLSRFGVVDNLANQFRGWGSLFNSDFELSFDNRLQFASYIYIAVLGILLVLNRRYRNKYILLSVVLVLICPATFVLRGMIAQLPLSNIIRDTGRFIVLTQLGFALGVAIFFAYIDKALVQIIFLLLILLSISPYLQGRLTQPEKILYGASEFGRDQRLRLLVFPAEENEKKLETVGDGANILMPTGSTVKPINDHRFDQAFAEIGDIDSIFSPFATGLFISDKSNPNVLNFANTFLGAAGTDRSLFEGLARVYGISNIFVRNGLRTVELGPEWGIDSCRQVLHSDSDWSISKICHISDAYPIIFGSTMLPNIGGIPFYAAVKDNPKSPDELITMVGCPSTLNIKDKGICKVDPGYDFFGAAPDVSFTRINRSTYETIVDRSENPNSDYLLVLNQSFHNGWILRDFLTGKELNYQKVLVNQLVNGWVIPSHPGVTKDRFVLEYYPQKIFNVLFPFSLVSLISATLFSFFFLFIKKSSNVN